VTIIWHGYVKAVKIELGAKPIRACIQDMYFMLIKKTHQYIT